MDACPTCSSIPRSNFHQRLEEQLGGDRDRVAKAEINRAFLSEQAVQPERRFAMPLFRPERQLHVNAPDHQDAALQLHLTNGFGHQTFVGSRNLTRLQRAPEGSGESTGRRGDDVIERRGVRFECVGRDLVVFGNGPVHAENNRLTLCGQICAAHRALDPLYANFGSICDMPHKSPPRLGLYAVPLPFARQAPPRWTMGANPRGRARQSNKTSLKIRAGTCASHSTGSLPAILAIRDAGDPVIPPITLSWGDYYEW